MKPTISISIDQDLERSLKNYARIRHISKSAVVERALDRYFATEDQVRIMDYKSNLKKQQQS